MTSRLGKAFLTLALGLMLLMGSTAYAAPADSAGGGAGEDVNVCGTTTTGRSTQYLPVERWSESTTSFHYRLDADGWNDLAEKVQRNGRDATFMQIGNAAWRLGADAMYASSTFCPIQTLGYPLDSLVGTIGKALTTTGLVTALVTVTIGSAVVSTRRGHGGSYVLKETLKTGAVLGVMSAMVLGAASSTKDGPGKGSPWWWVNQANTVVNSVSGTLASTTVDSSQDLLGYQNLSSDTGSAADWPVTCTTTDGVKGYVDYLHDKYDASYTQDGSANAKAAALPEMVSTMWESGVLPVWAAAQFGASNPYSDHIYCFFLEARSQSTVSSNEVLKDYLAERLDWSEETKTEWGENTRAQNSSGGNREDHSLLSWGACIPASDGGEESVRGEWKTITKPPSADDCHHWWMGGGDLEKSSLDWDEDSVGDRAAGSASVYNYAATLHGRNGSQVGGIMFAYLIGSLISGAILLLLSLLQLGSKLVVAFMVAGVYFALVRSLAPGDDGKLFRRTGLQLLGASFVSSCANLMIAVIMMVAGVIAKVGTETFSPGTTGAVLAACLGPAAGVFLLHWICTSVLHVPSPFSVKGAMAWGQGITSGVIGGAVGSGVTNLLSNAKDTAKKGRGHPDARPRPGDGRRKPGQIDPSKTRRGENRSIFTERSATESLHAGEERKRKRKQRLDEAHTEREERRQNVQDESKRLAKADGHLGDDDAWKGYRARARSNLRHVKRDQLKDTVKSMPGRAMRRVGTGVRQTGTRISQNLDATHALAGWAAHHPTRAAAAAGATGWRTAAAGARTAASGVGALRNMPAKKAVAAGAGAALAAGSAPVAAGLVASAAGAGWVRQHALAASAARAQESRGPITSHPYPYHLLPDSFEGTPEAPVQALVASSADTPVGPEPPPTDPSGLPETEPQPGAGERRMQRVDELADKIGDRPVSEPVSQSGDALARKTLERMRDVIASERRNDIS